MVRSLGIARLAVLANEGGIGRYNTKMSVSSESCNCSMALQVANRRYLLGLTEKPFRIVKQRMRLALAKASHGDIADQMWG